MGESNVGVFENMPATVAKNKSSCQVIVCPNSGINIFFSNLEKSFLLQNKGALLTAK